MTYSKEFLDTVTESDIREILDIGDSTALLRAFNWSNSPQGHDFWEKAYRLGMNDVAERHLREILQLKTALDSARGPWLQTYTGLRFHPLDPKPEEINITDVAHALAMVCRFGGHVLRFYSVAEHCVLLVRLVRDGRAGAGLTESQLIALQRALLLHDAAEAYLGDMLRPTKSAMPEYCAIEERVQNAIHTRFGVVLDPMTIEFVKGLDYRILADERAQNLAQILWDDNPGPLLGVQLQFWSPEKAEAEFLKEYLRLFH